MDAPAASARGGPTQPAAQNVSLESRRASQCSAGTWQNPPPEWPSVAGSQWVSLPWPKFTSGLWRLSQKRPVEKFNFGWSCIYVRIHEWYTYFLKGPEHRLLDLPPFWTEKKNSRTSWRVVVHPNLQAHPSLDPPLSSPHPSFLSRGWTPMKKASPCKFTLFTGGVWFYRAFAVSHRLPWKWSPYRTPTWKNPASGTKIWKSLVRDCYKMGTPRLNTSPLP